MLLKGLEGRYLSNSWGRYFPTPLGVAGSEHSSSETELAACRDLLAKLGDAYASEHTRDWWTPELLSPAVEMDLGTVQRALVYLSAAGLLDTHFPESDSGLVGRVKITDRFLDPQPGLQRFEGMLNDRNPPQELLQLPHVYDYVGELGFGGFGVVHRYRHRLLGLDFAIKILDPTFRGASEKDVNRFFQEVNILFRLRHQNIIQVHDLGLMPDGKPYMRLELFEGEPLSALLKEGRLEPQKARQVIRAVASAIGHAHEMGVYHRDLKASNVLIDEVGGCRVIDFGLSIWLEAALSQRLSSGNTELLGGIHTAPELRANPLLTDARTDVYSLGCLYYEMLVGRAVSTEPERVLTQEVPDLPVPTRRLILSSLSEDPDDRPPTPGIFFEALGTDKQVNSKAPGVQAAQFASLMASFAEEGPLGSTSEQRVQVLDYGAPPHGAIEHEQNRFFLLRGQAQFMFKARVCVVAPPHHTTSVLELEVQVAGQRLSCWRKTSVDVHWGSSGTRACVVGQETELWSPTQPLVIRSGESVVRKVCGVIAASAVKDAEMIEGIVVARDALGNEWRSAELAFHRYHPR
tara:strand:- start:3592 stop:5319 length:1728 start_codon:yes stop_codon:yes gene_type:complete